MKNEKNLISAKEAAKKISEAASGSQVVVTRVNVNPCCDVRNFASNAALTDKKAALDVAISAYKAICIEKGDIITAWTAVENALADYNSEYKAAQIGALRDAGVSVYVMSPMRRECKVRRDKTGIVKSVDYVDVPVLPDEFDTRENPMFASVCWKDIFKALATACGFVFGAENAFENREGVSSRAKIKAALADCMQAVFGAECKYSPRAADISALLYSIASRDTRNVNSFKKMPCGLFRWCIIDTIGAAMCGATYKFTETKKTEE